jgi:transposase
MAKALSVGLRRRVVDSIEQGLSCRKAADRFGVSASSAIRWRDRLKKEGDITPQKQGGDRKSGRIEAEASFILGAVAETPDITLVELQEKLQVRGVKPGAGRCSITVIQNCRSATNVQCFISRARGVYRRRRPPTTTSACELSVCKYCFHGLRRENDTA